MKNIFKRHNLSIRQEIISATTFFPIVLLFLSLSAEGQIVVEKLGPEINTSKYDEISPVVNPNDKTLYFTRLASKDFDRTLMVEDKNLATSLSQKAYENLLKDIYGQLAGQEVKDPISSNYNQDIWFAGIDLNQTWTKHPAYPLNNALPNSVCAYIQDSRELLLINQFYKDGSMHPGFSMSTHYTDDSFSFPSPLHIYDFYTDSKDVSIHMSEDKEVIILSLKRKDTDGDSDLYVSFKTGPNIYSRPKNLGKDINSSSRESSPFLSKDKRRLFFSSNRPESLGGSDIYVSLRQDFSFEKWSKPKPLKAPINSEFDDAEPYLSEESGYLYFTSLRDGSSDIFRIELEPPSVLEHEITIFGQVVDKKTGELISASVLYGPANHKEYLEFFRSANGFFRVKLKINQVIKFFTEKNNYRGKQILFDPNILVQQGKNEAELRLFMDSEDGSISVLEVQPKNELASLDKERIPFDLQNIQFERTTAKVLSSSYDLLDQIVNYLKREKSMRIRIEGHTDNVGEKRLLFELSEKRAKTIQHYFVQKGIEESRIEVIGLADTKPLNDNRNETEKAKNRRVEIKILNK